MRVEEPRYLPPAPLSKGQGLQAAVLTAYTVSKRRPAATQTPLPWMEGAGG